MSLLNPAFALSYPDTHPLGISRCLHLLTWLPCLTITNPICPTHGIQNNNINYSKMKRLYEKSPQLPMPKSCLIKLSRNQLQQQPRPFKSWNHFDELIRVTASKWSELKWVLAGNDTLSYEWPNELVQAQKELTKQGSSPDPRSISFVKCKLLGRGDVGKVFLVRQKATDKLYAMKGKSYIAHGERFRDGLTHVQPLLLQFRQCCQKEKWSSVTRSNVYLLNKRYWLLPIIRLL